MLVSLPADMTSKPMQVPNQEFGELLEFVHLLNVLWRATPANAMQQAGGPYRHFTKFILDNVLRHTTVWRYK